MPHRRIAVEERDNCIVVSLLDRNILDEAVVQHLGEELESIVKEKIQIVLDWSKVDYISSSGLMKLVTTKKLIAKAHGKLTLCNDDRQIWEIFRLTKLNNRFAIHDSQESAIAALQQ